MKNIVLVIFLLSINNVFSQNFKFGKVSKEELLETSYSKDKTANAVVLYKEKKIHYEYKEDEGFVKITEVFERIKIYNKDGFNWATKKIGLYNANDKDEEHLLGLKAYTYNLEGDKIVDYKLKKNGVFEEIKNKFWKQSKFTMPNLKEGSVIEFKYRIESPYISLDKDIFQYNIPIKKFDYKLNIPEYFVFKKVLNLKATYIPEIKESLKGRKFMVSYHPSKGSQLSRTGRFSKENLVERTFDITEKVYKANLQDIPALKEEIFTDNLNNYRAIVKWEFVKRKYFDGSVKEVSNNWEQVTKTIYENSSFGGQLERNNYYKEDINTLIKGLSDTLEKAAVIFNFVKSKVKWNDFISYYTENGVKKAYKEGEGNTADINLMLTSMLRYAGVNANPVLISTRDNGIPIVPSRSGFNYVVSAIEMPQGYIFLDATSNYTTANILPIRALNWQGRIIRKNGSSDWVSLTPKEMSKEIISLNVKINSDLSITGKVRHLLTNHLALDYREEYNNLNKESHIMSLEKDKDDIEISNLEIKDKNELSKPITVSYEYNLDNAIEEIGDKLYFSPLLFLALDENPFKQETRLYPIDFIYKISEKNIINIMLPDGYIVDTFPESTKVQFNDGDGEFSYLARENGRMLQLTISLNLNKTLILPKEYDQFKQLYQIMLEKQTEQIVLKKE